MDIQQHVKRGQELSIALGKSKFQSVCKEIASTIVKNNLDATPKMLNDVFSYIADEIAISRI